MQLLGDGEEGVEVLLLDVYLAVVHKVEDRVKVTWAYILNQMGADF